MRHVAHSRLRTLVPATLALVTMPAFAGEVRGRFLLGQKPASGVAVSAIPHETPHEAAKRIARGGEEPKPAATVTTGPDGAFVLAVPASAGGGFVVRAEGGGVRATELDGIFDPGETADTGDHELTRGEALAGKVVDRSGQPVPGAFVTLQGATAMMDADLHAAPVRATTGPDGTFRVEGAAPTGGLLLIEKPGFAPVSEIGVRSGALHKPITLAPGITVTGLVRPLPGKSAAGALVRVEGRTETRWVEAGEDGSFTIPNAPEGKVTLVADAGDAGYGQQPGVVLPLPEGKKAAVTLFPPAAFEGRVVDAKTLRAVPRAKVSVGRGASRQTVRSGPDGRYRLAGLAPGTFRLEVDESRYVLFTKSAEVAAGETRKLDAPLTPGASISGRVTDEGGQPVGGAQGVLQHGGSTGIAGMLRRMSVAGTPPAFRSGPDGTFRASRLVPGDGQRLTVAHPDFAPATLGGVNLVGGQTAANVAVVLRRGAVISGVVRDGEGNPIPDAEVETTAAFTGFARGRGGTTAQVNMLGAPGGPLARPAVKSAADGRFQIHGVPPGDQTVSVRKAGYATERIDPVKVPEAGSPEPLAVTLVPGAAISGTVMLRSGAPAEGWSVVASEPGTSPFGARGRGNLQPTGSDGFFFLDGLKAGHSYDLSLLGGTGLGPARKGVAAPASGVEITVTGTGRIAGRAVDAETGRPLAEFQVSYEPDRTGGGAVFRIVNRAAGQRLTGMGEKTQVRSEDGAFTLEEVPPGTWSVLVEAKGYQTARAGSVVVEEGATAKDVELKVARGALLKGHVTDARTGRPVPNAAVTHAEAGAPGAAIFALVAGAGDGDIASDADGRFEIDGLAPGKLSVTAKHPDYADATQSVDLKDGGTAVEIPLTTGGDLGGTVFSEAGPPVPGADVQLAAAGDSGFGRMALGGGPSTTTDGAGRFRFDHLTAGRYSVTATLQSHTSAPLTVVLQAGDSREDLALQLATGSTVRGVVSGIPDSWKNGMTVTATGADAYFSSTRTGADGRFEFAGVPAGTVTLRGTAGDFAGSSRSVTKQVDVADAQPVVETELVFEPGYVLSGRVTRSGQPLPGTTVFANLQGGGGRQASSRTDDGGSYRMEGLAEGTYMVNALSSVFGGSSRRQTVSLTGDQTLDIAFPAAKLGGTVVDAQGKTPLPDAVVEISATDPNAGPMMRNATTDSNGSFLLPDLDPLTYTVNVRKPGYLFEKRDVAAAEQGTDALTFELTRGDGIGIVARDGLYGVPLHGLLVRVLDAARAPVFQGSISLDGEGRGEIPSLKPGTYTLMADASGYAVATLAGVTVPSAPVTVSLTPGGSVEIHSGPKTLAAGTARAQIQTAAGVPYPLSLFGADGSFMISTPVRRLDNLAPGSYLLTVAGAGAKSFAVQEGGVAVVELP